MGYMKKLAMELDEYQYLRDDEWVRLEREQAEMLIMEQIFEEERVVRGEEIILTKPLEKARVVSNLASYGNNNRPIRNKLPRFIQAEYSPVRRDNEIRLALGGSIYNRVSNRGNRPKKSHSKPAVRGYIPVFREEGLPF